MAPAFDAIEAQLDGRALQILYPDDRSGWASDVGALEQVLRAWDVFGSVGPPDQPGQNSASGSVERSRAALAAVSRLGAHGRSGRRPGR
eukprot:6200085-Alexandrium_andersonii.AAC.1